MHAGGMFAGRLCAVILTLGFGIPTVGSAQDRGAEPLRITSVTPSGEDVPAGRQIVFQFNRPVVPIGRMSRDAAEIPIEIEPALACQWRWIDPSALACQLGDDQSLAPATRYALTLRPGLRAPDGATISAPLEHAFVTERPGVVYASFRTWRAPGLPVIRVIFSQPVARSSVADHMFIAESGNRRPLQIEPDEYDRELPRFAYTSEKRAEHGAVLVVDNRSREVLAWVVGGGGDQAGPRTHIDAVRAPRQPGSAMKPLLYGLALDSGWTAATVIDDSPLAADVGPGLHAYQNYSRRFYGPIGLRDALGNSLNIPALKALHFVGSTAYLGFLRELGFTSLNDHPDVYGDGLALGNGAVSLYELVQAYAALANGGQYRPLTVLAEPGRQSLGGQTSGRQVLSAEGASLIANILSDRDARSLEFGRASVLNFQAPTAVKTGTSSDFRDAWAVGFDARHTVGVWMGNLDQTPSQGVTGSTGPAILLRSIFTELSRNKEPQPLYLSPGLRRASVCAPDPNSPSRDCVMREEWFVPGTEPAVPHVSAPAYEAIEFFQPTPGLLLAMDPRLPPEHQAFEFRLGGTEPGDRVDWKIDGNPHRTLGGSLLWDITRGTHQVGAEVWRGSKRIAVLDPFGFTVK